MDRHLINNSHVKSFQEDGVVLVKGLFKDFVNIIRDGIDYNIKNPGPYSAENLHAGESGRFFDDYCKEQQNQWGQASKVGNHHRE